MSNPIIRREAILRTAMGHFSRYGYEGAGLRNIARDAGTSMSLLNHHFGLKPRLFQACADVVTAADARRARQVAMVRTRGTYEVADLVRAWAQAGLDVYHSQDGPIIFRLMALGDLGLGHVASDPNELAVNELASGLVVCYPQADVESVVEICRILDAAMTAWLVSRRKLAAGLEIGADREDSGETQLIAMLTASATAAMSTAPGTLPPLTHSVSA